MKRRKKIPRKRKILDKKLIFSTGIIAVIVLGLVFYKVFFQTSEIKFSLKAAIIDQLGKDFPNSTFSNNVTALLESVGFNVSYHKSENITVNFYKGLAKSNYGIIILRAHSALRNQTPPVVDLFTSEEYTNSTDVHYDDRRKGLLAVGKYYWNPNMSYFAVKPEFIEELDSPFPNSIVIAMGCWSLKPGCEQMANAFIKKGAKAYIGWTDMVYPQDTDNETVKLLKLLLDEDKPLGYAIDNTKNYTCQFGGQTVTTHLDFYPKSGIVANLTISELIKEAKASITLQTTFYSFDPLLPLLFATNVINHNSKDF